MPKPQCGDPWAQLRGLREDLDILDGCFKSEVPSGGLQASGFEFLMFSDTKFSVTHSAEAPSRNASDDNKQTLLLAVPVQHLEWLKLLVEEDAAHCRASGCSSCCDGSRHVPWRELHFAMARACKEHGRASD